jgi:hypothetical protein
VEAWLRSDLTIKATVVHERLIAEHGFSGHCQRVKIFLSEAGRGSPPRCLRPTITR